MLRAVIGVIVGDIVWTVLWLGGGAFLFAGVTEPAGGGVPAITTGTLLGALGLSVVCSLAGGATAGVIARDRSRGASITLAALLVLTGLGVQLSMWSDMPLWYHLCFLGLLAPATLVGGRFV